MSSQSAANLELAIVYVTVPSLEVGTKLARTLVSENLVACVNLIPGLTSFYRWQGKINEEPEALLLIKTTEAVLSELEARVKELHPYDNPEFVAVAATHVAVNYAKWVQDQIEQA